MSDLESMCNIDNGTYTDAPVLTADVRKLFNRIAELEQQLAELRDGINKAISIYRDNPYYIAEVMKGLAALLPEVK